MYTLIPSHQIALRIAELGRQIGEKYRDKPLLILGVLNGSVVFVADLMRSIQVPHQVGFIQASSYCGRTTNRGELTTDLKFMPEIHGRNVLLVDDIFDTGKTMQRLLTELSDRGAVDVQTAVLLWKTERQEVEITPDYFGFQIPNRFVVGYGLDYDDDYRHLPDIMVLDDTDAIS